MYFFKKMNNVVIMNATLLSLSEGLVYHYYYF